MTDLPFTQPPDRPALGATPRCRRHVWEQTVCDMPWPARCRHCRLVTEDPDGCFVPIDWAEASGHIAYECPPSPTGYHEADDKVRCLRCSATRDQAASRRGRRNRARGNAEELTVARTVGGRKVGPLGQPWDVEMPGYSRLQVKKLATPPSLRFIAAELARIGSGAEMAGFVWVEPGRGGEKLIVFRLADFAERHGIVVEDAA